MNRLKLVFLLLIFVSVSAPAQVVTMTWEEMSRIKSIKKLIPDEIKKEYGIDNRRYEIESYELMITGTIGDSSNSYILENSIDQKIPNDRLTARMLSLLNEYKAGFLNLVFYRVFVTRNGEDNRCLLQSFAIHITPDASVSDTMEITDDTIAGNVNDAATPPETEVTDGNDAFISDNAEQANKDSVYATIFEELRSFVDSLEESEDSLAEAPAPPADDDNKELIGKFSKCFKKKSGYETYMKFARKYKTETITYNSVITPVTNPQKYYEAAFKNFKYDRHLKKVYVSDDDRITEGWYFYSDKNLIRRVIVYFNEQKEFAGWNDTTVHQDIYTPSYLPLDSKDF